MPIRVALAGPGAAQPQTIVLDHSGWNDWWKYKTTYSAVYIGADGHENPLGTIKIGQFGLEPGSKEGGSVTPPVPVESPGLPEDFFSVGQDIEYYSAVKLLGDVARTQIHESLQDLAYSPELFERARAENVFIESLSRDLSLTELTGQWRRVAHGGAVLTRYNFEYCGPAFMGSDLTLSFDVSPTTRPPSNIHVIIGRNGVGKSTLLHNMAQSLVPESQSSDTDHGTFRAQDGHEFSGFTNAVSVSYSMFDQYDPIDIERLDAAGFSRIGLDGTDEHASLGALIDAADACTRGPRKTRLLKALEVLENDLLFNEQQLSRHLAEESAETFVSLVPIIYSRLSSGHKIVFRSILRLVESVEEKSLVLLDEPETHLHPPLLSAYIRALSELLTDRNGVAIIATHSPVVLQEVPSNCVYKLARSGNTCRAGRPEIETFGENVGTLTNEVFGLEVAATGFHTILTEIASEAWDYELALDELSGHLGAEGRSILRSRILKLRTDRLS